MLKRTATILAICLCLSACDSGKAEREYLKGIRPDYDSVRASVTSLDEKLKDSNSADDLDKTVQHFDAALQQLSQLKTKAGESQVRRKTLAGSVKDRSVLDVDKEIDVYYYSIQKRADDTAQLIQFFKEMLKTFSRLQKSMEMINSSSDDLGALVRALEEMKSAFSNMVLQLGDLSVPENKPGLAEVRQTAIDQFKKSIPIIDDMINGINKKSSSKIEAASKRFEDWAAGVENSFQKQMDEQMQKEIAPLDTGWEKINTETAQLGDSISRLEGKFGQ